MRAVDDVERFVPRDLLETYEVISVRGAAALMHTNHKALFDELLEALRAFTYGSAYASFEERRKGTLEVGKLADLVVLKPRKTMQVRARLLLHEFRAQNGIGWM